MKTHHITIINAIILIIMGFWGYYSSETPSYTSFIPVVAGVLFLIFSQGIKKSNSTVAHLTVFLTLVILVALIKPLTSAFSRNDAPAIARVLIMMLTCTIALVFYIRSFIEARKQRR